MLELPTTILRILFFSFEPSVVLGTVVSEVTTLGANDTLLTDKLLDSEFSPPKSKLVDAVIVLSRPNRRGCNSVFLDSVLSWLVCEVNCDDVEDDCIPSVKLSDLKSLSAAVSFVIFDKFVLS